MSSFVFVALREDPAEEAVEVPTESDGTVLLSSVAAQFPGAAGLKFRNSATKGMRGVRITDGVLHPPSDDGWGEARYICVRQEAEAGLKRSSTDVEGKEVESKKSKVANQVPATVDLIVLGINYMSSEDAVKSYFEKFGQLIFCQLKTREDGSSRGFAFIRFKDVAAQEKVLQQRHRIDDRWCDVKVPDSSVGDRAAPDNCRIFVGRVTKDLTKNDLEDYFSQFGEVTDIFYPTQPFRSFAFVTFAKSEAVQAVQSLFGKDHIIKGVSVRIDDAVPKRGGGDMGFDRGGGMGGYRGGGHRGGDSWGMRGRGSGLDRNYYYC